MAGWYSLYKHSSPDTTIRRTSSFIRLHLEYAMAAWDPSLRKDIELLENVQKYALIVCFKQWDADCTTLSPLMAIPSIPVPLFWAEYSTIPVELCTTNPLYPSSVALCSSKVHLFPSSITAWNSLLPETAFLPTIASFKRAIE